MFWWEEAQVFIGKQTDDNPVWLGKISICDWYSLSNTSPNESMNRQNNNKNKKE